MNEYLAIIIGCGLILLDICAALFIIFYVMRLQDESEDEE